MKIKSLFPVLVFVVFVDSLFSVHAKEQLLVPEYELNNSVVFAIPECNSNPQVQEILGLMSAINIHSNANITLLTEDPSCKKQLEKLGVTKLNFIDVMLESPWVQDFRPVIYKIEEAIKWAQFRFWGSEIDEKATQKLAEFMDTKLLTVDVVLEGGNLEVAHKGRCLTAVQRDIKTEANQTSNRLKIKQELLQLGCTEVIFLDAIIGESTGHIDVFAKVYAPNKVLLADYDKKAYPRQHRQYKKNKRILENHGFDVTVIDNSFSEDIHYTYVNSLIILDTAFIPQYGIRADKKAKKIYEKLGFKVVGVDSKHAIKGGGSLHCLSALIN